MRFEGGGRRPTRRPPAKTSTREPLLRQPKALRVVDQTLDRRPASIPKHEQRPAEGISVKDLAADAGQPVNPFPKILGSDGHQDAHLRRDLDPASTTAMARLSCARTGRPTRCRGMAPVVPSPS